MIQRIIWFKIGDLINPKNAKKQSLFLLPIGHVWTPGIEVLIIYFTWKYLVIKFSLLRTIRILLIYLNLF